MLKGYIRNLVSVSIIAVVVSLFSGCTARRLAEELSVSAVIKSDTPVEPSTTAEGISRNNTDTIKLLYEKAGTMLSQVWGSKEKISQMLAAIHSSSQDGLNPADYHQKQIDDLIKRIVFSDKPEIMDIGNLETMLSDAFVLLGTNLLAGKTNPDTLNPEWKTSRRMLRQNWSSYLDSALNRSSIAGTLQSLAPGHEEYTNLKKALAIYRQIEENGGWTTFNTSRRKLEKGMRNPDVPLLRKRLEIVQGNIRFDPEDENLFDQSLEDQLIIFQKRNGLDPDGVAGKKTVETLNIPVSERIETIKANLERWRWISDDLGKRYLLVNVAGCTLTVVENDRKVLQTPAIVGQMDKQTPLFSATLRYLVLNPVWAVPPTILKEEIIPAVIKDPSYLAEKNMRVLRLDGTEADPSSIEWDSIPEKGFPYMIHQEPGQGNPLGRIKFVFPNRFNVYIHDTPSKGLFLRSNRTFSHGCIRIDNALEVAEYLLKDNPGYDHARLRKDIDDGKEKAIILSTPVPVHIVYLTAWADDDGSAYFSTDIYDRDNVLITALREPVPGQRQKLADTESFSGMK